MFLFCIFLSGAFSWYKSPHLATALQSSPLPNGLMPHSPNGTASSAGPMPILPYSPFLQQPTALSPAAILSPSFSFYPSPSLHPTMPLSTMPSFLYPYYASQTAPTSILPRCPFVVPKLASSFSYSMRKNGYSQEPTIFKSKSETDVDVATCTTDDCNRIDPRRIPPPTLIPIQHSSPNHLSVIMSSPAKRVQSCDSYKTCISSRQRKLSHP